MDFLLIPVLLKSRITYTIQSFDGLSLAQLSSADYFTPTLKIIITLR